MCMQCTQFYIQWFIYKKISLERLLDLEGTIRWLDNVMFTFFSTLLLFPVEYNIKKKQFNDVLPSVVFIDTQDNMLKTNPCIRNKIFKLLR